MDRQYTIMWTRFSRKDRCFGPVPKYGEYVAIPHTGTHKVIGVTYIYKEGTSSEIMSVEDIMVSID